MLPALEQSLDPRAVGLWRVEGVFRSLTYLVLGLIALGGAAALTPERIWLVLVVLGLVVLYGILAIGILPKLRYRLWRYELREQELEIQYGLLVIRRLLIPLVRVQHVDTRQGPLARWFGLSAVTVATAGSTHEIPALNDTTANLLRDRISALARTARDAL
jgi:hypothetical protein